MMRTKQGFAHILLLVIGVFVLVIVVMISVMALNNNGASDIVDYANQMKDAREMMEEEAVPSAAPISDDISIDTIEQELNATVTGDFEGDINSMEEDVDSL